MGIRSHLRQIRMGDAVRHRCSIRKRRNIPPQSGTEGRIRSIQDSDADGCTKKINCFRPPFQYSRIRLMVLCHQAVGLSGKGEQGLDHRSKEQQEDTD